MYHLFASLKVQLVIRRRSGSADLFLFFVYNVYYQNTDCFKGTRLCGTSLASTAIVVVEHFMPSFYRDD